MGVFPCLASDMEEGNRFEEVDDAFLEEWAGEIKEEKDCSFAKMCGPIRALFATDSVVLSKFEDCLDHMERLSFLLNMEVKKCKKCKKDLTAIVKVSRKLQELSKDFRMIMDTISEESAHQQIKHISSLLKEVEKVCKPPCKELITCQQVLIQCFAMLGNTVKVEIPAEKAQLVPFTGGASYSDDEEDTEDEFDMPGLI